jgi:hypothetical protein
MSKEPSVHSVPSEDQLRGQQLTQQWELACAGMIEIIKFGAMMLQLRQFLIPRAESKHTGSGRYAKGEGMKAWLEEFAPSISRTTAERYMALAESLQDHFRLGKRVDLALLLSSPDEELGQKLAEKKSALLDFVYGKSQRQLLFELSEGHRGGGAGDPGGAHVITYEQLTLRLHDACVTAAATLQGIHAQKAYYALNDAELDGFINHAEEVAAEAKRWRNLSKSERESIAQDQLAKLLK